MAEACTLKPAPSMQRCMESIAGVEMRPMSATVSSMPPTELEKTPSMLRFLDGYSGFPPPVRPIVRKAKRASSDAVSERDRERLGNYFRD